MRIFTSPFVRAAGMATLCCTAAIGPLAHAADVPGAPAGEPPRIELDFRPANVQMSNSIQFDEKGQPQGGYGNCYANFNVYGKTAARLVGYEPVKITKLTGPAGQSLPLPAGNSSGVSRMNRRNEAPWLFSASISLPLPPDHLRSLGEISGTINVWYAVGATRVAPIGPFKDIAGKSIRIEGLAKPVTLVINDEKPQNRIRIDVPRAFEMLIDRIRAFDAGGRDLNANDSGHGWNDNTAQRYLSVRMPDDGKLQISFFEDARSVTVPFKVLNLPLPQPPKGKGAEVVVKAVPAEELRLAPGEKKDDAPPLKVIVQ